MIWRRTVVLFFLALAMSVPFTVDIYRESDPCKTRQKSELQRELHLVIFQEAEIGFQPCFVDRGLSVWWKIAVLTSFFLWSAFFCSLVLDVFLYVRERRRGTIEGRFRWLRRRRSLQT